MRTIVLLLASNLFMTIAWYGHLRFEGVALWKVILVSWGIAFFEYCLQVPANRFGVETFTVFQLKIIQEVMSLLVFAGFAVVWLGQTPKWNHALAALLIVGAVALVFVDGPPKTAPTSATGSHPGDR